LIAALIAVAGLGLAGCRGSVNMDLSAESPANPQIAQINVNLAGIEFERADGGTEKLTFTASERTDLIDLLDSNPLRLFTDEELKEGSYTGVRLLLEDNDDATVVLSDGNEFPAVLGESSFAPVDITVEEDKSSSRNLVLTLALRKSLDFDDDSGEYTLTPSLRVVEAEEAGTISGSVSVTCPAGTSLQQGGAVYLFEGEDSEPDEIDGAGTEPYATTAIINDVGTGFRYALAFLPRGDYTIAATCNGNLDAPSSRDDVNFLRGANVSIDADAVTYDITD